MKPVALLCAIGILAQLFLFNTSAFACEESATDVPVNFSGTLMPLSSFDKDITQRYYYAVGKFGQKVKVPAESKTNLIFWLIPDERGWSIKIAPYQNLNPDYIQITNWPQSVTNPLHIDKSVSQTRLKFCYVDDAHDYDSALKGQNTGKNSMAEMLANSCKADDNSSLVGHGTIVTNKDASGNLVFSVHLKAPIYTTDCPPP